MSQNIYDNPDFFAGYATLPRSAEGLNGAPEWTAMQTLLPSLAGKSVIDLGCGYGWFCRWAKEQGAARVTGFDLSEKMLAKAASMTTDPDITYLRADLETLQLPALFATLYQALVPGGSLVFSAEHPIYTAPVIQNWCTDSAGNKAWPVNQYQQEGVRISNWFADGVEKQHRKLSTWINALITAGFEITAMNEWGPSAAQIAANPVLDEEKERPMIFLLSARKP